MSTPNKFTVEMEVTVEVEYLDTVEDPLVPGGQINRYFVTKVDDNLPSVDEIIYDGDYGIYPEET